MAEDSFFDDADACAYRLQVGSFAAAAEYRRAAGVLTVLHVVADEQLRGSGAAGRLMQQVADTARAQGVKIEVECPFAASWFERRPNQRDLLI